MPFVYDGRRKLKDHFRVVILAPRVVNQTSIMVQEIINRTGITHNNHYLQSSHFYSTGHRSDYKI